MGMETHGITNTFALLGKALTGTEEGGYQIARHLTDYVLFWGGGGGDDLAKSPHLARIANSVYRDHCPGDVTCRAFGFLVSFICLQQFHTFVLSSNNSFSFLLWIAKVLRLL